MAKPIARGPGWELRPAILITGLGRPGSALMVVIRSVWPVWPAMASAVPARGDPGAAHHSSAATSI